MLLCPIYGIGYVTLLNLSLDRCLPDQDFLRVVMKKGTNLANTLFWQFYFYESFIMFTINILHWVSFANILKVVLLLDF